MVLSKAKDRDRKRKFRLESNPTGFRIGDKVLEPAYVDYYREKAKASGFEDLADYLLDVLHKRVDGKQPVRSASTRSLPLYNPAVHKVGDRVMVRQGKQLVEAVVPELDGDGHSVPAIM